MPRIGVGIGIGLPPIVAASGGYDADAQAFFDRVTTAGGTLTTTEKNAVNQLVLDMKSAGIWTSMKAVYPMVGASAAACAQNLISSSFTGTFSSGWTFASTGVTPNGTSAYMNTGLNLLSNYGTSFNNHFSIYYRTDSTNYSKYGAIGIVYSDGMSAHIDYVNNNTYNDNMGRNQLSNSSYGTSNAFHLSSLTSTSSQKLFRNNVLKINGSANNTSVYPNQNFYFGGLNENGTAGYFDDRQIAFGSIGDGLTDTQASNFYTAVQTFNQTLNRQVGAQIVSDADAQAFVNRVYTAGGTLTNTEANAVNQLVIDMKAAGIWTSMKAVYPMVGASAAACAQNLKSSSFTGTFSSGWTFASTGITGNGTSAYMDTGFVPSSNLSISSASLSVYTRTSGIGGSGYPVDLGCDIPATGFNVSQKMVGSPQYHGRIFVQTIDGVDGNNVAGLQLVSRNSTTSLKYYRNGTLIQTNSTLEVGPIPNINAYLGALNNNGSPTIYSVREYAFAHLSDGLTDTQSASLYTCVQTFNTSLSRQV